MMMLLKKIDPVFGLAWCTTLILPYLTCIDIIFASSLFFLVHDVVEKL